MASLARVDLDGNPIKTMTICMIGAGGFFGSHLCEKFMSETSHKVLAMDVYSDKIKNLLEPSSLPWADRIQFHRINIKNDSRLEGLIKMADLAGGFPEPEIVHYNPKDFHFGKKKAFPFRAQVQQSQARQGPSRRRVKKFAARLMDYEQTIIAGQMYQCWLRNTSDIVSRRGTKRKHWGTMPSMKIAKLMELPPVGLLCGLFTNQKSYYPAPLLKQWMRSTQPPQDCPSGRKSPAQPPEPSSSSPLKRPYVRDTAAFVAAMAVTMVITVAMVVALAVCT